MCTTLHPTWMFASVLFQCVANHYSVLSCPFPWIQVLVIFRIVAFDLRLLRTDCSVCGVSLNISRWEVLISKPLGNFVWMDLVGPWWRKVHSQTNKPEFWQLWKQAWRFLSCLKERSKNEYIFISFIVFVVVSTTTTTNSSCCVDSEEPHSVPQIVWECTHSLSKRNRQSSSYRTAFLKNKKCNFQIGNHDSRVLYCADVKAILWRDRTQYNNRRGRCPIQGASKQSKKFFNLNYLFSSRSLAILSSPITFLVRSRSLSCAAVAVTVASSCRIACQIFSQMINFKF